MTGIRYRSLARACRLVVAVTVAAFASSASAGGGIVVNTGYFGGVAIKGYDPVAYFTDGRATKGSEEFVYDWLGATWHFANAEHRELFTKQPVRYAPQYGGFCTDSVADNVIVNVDPEAWRIVNGKLYLFGMKAGLEEYWDSNPAAIVAKADANWPALEAKLIAR